MRLGSAGVHAASLKGCPVWWHARLCCALSWWLSACRKKFAQIELFNFWSYNQVRYMYWERNNGHAAASGLPHAMASHSCPAGLLSDSVATSVSLSSLSPALPVVIQLQLPAELSAHGGPLQMAGPAPLGCRSCMAASLWPSCLQPCRVLQFVCQMLLIPALSLMLSTDSAQPSVRLPALCHAQAACLL